MDEETKQKVCEELALAKKHLREAHRVAKTDPNVSKHLIRAIVRMVEDIGYEAARVKS